MSSKTYYQLLGVSPTVAPAEIEAAYEAQYNRWRRLVTHHDPSVVNQANQMLQALEQVRATLTDPKRRVAYDAGLEAIGGLSSVQEEPQAPSFSSGGSLDPFAAGAQTPTGEKQDRVDAWICPKCHTANAIGSKHCRQCGHTIGVTCPECNTLVEATEFCTACGTDLPKAVRRKELRGEIARTQHKLDKMREYNPRRDEEVKRLRKATVAAGAWMGFGGAGFLAVVMDWKGFVLSEPHMAVLTGVLVALGAYALWTLVLTIVRRTSSASAFWATLDVLVVAGFPMLSFVAIGYLDVSEPDFIAAGLISRLVLNLVLLIAAMGLCGRLRAHGGWIWLLFLLILPAAPCTVLWDGWLLLYEWDEAPPMWDYIELTTMAQVAGYVVLAVSFGLLALRAWWVTHRVEHQVAVELDKKETNTKTLKYQLRQFELELNALQRI